MPGDTQNTQDETSGMEDPAHGLQHRQSAGDPKTLSTQRIKWIEDLSTAATDCQTMNDPRLTVQDGKINVNYTAGLELRTIARVSKMETPNLE